MGKVKVLGLSLSLPREGISKLEVLLDSEVVDKILVGRVNVLGLSFGLS